MPDKPTTPSSTADHLRPAFTGRGEELRADLIEQIWSGQLSPGDRIAPVQQLAQSYGISYGTARRTLQVLDSEGWVDCIPRKRTVVASRQQLDTLRTNGGNPSRGLEACRRTAAIVWNPVNHALSRLRQELSRTLAGRGMQLLDIPGKRGVSLDYYKPWIEQWRQTPPRAILTHSEMPAGFWDAVEQATQHQSHLVRMFETEEVQTRLPGWHHVGVDHAALGELVASQMEQLGAKRLGLLVHRRAIDPHYPPHYSFKRHTGHTPVILEVGRAMRRRGRSADFTIRYSSLPHGTNNPLVPENVASIRRWLESKNRPDLIVGQDFRITVVAILAADLGLDVGRQIHLLGLENTPWAAHFGFQSISFNEEIIAEHIADLIGRDVQKKSGAVSIKVAPSLEPAQQDSSLELLSSTA